MKNILESYASAFSISAFERQLKGHGLAGSKRSIADYLRYLEEAFFLIAIEKFDFSPRKRMMNPEPASGDVFQRQRRMRFHRSGGDAAGRSLAGMLGDRAL
jgi:hypothetical protein